jgi:hypothetical protein
MIFFAALNPGQVTGKLLSQGVRDIYDEFVMNMEKWHQIEYGIIDIGASQFSADYDSFHAVMRDLDRRLCQVVLTAFDDCATMTATFKLLDSFEGLLDREVISQVDDHLHYGCLVRNMASVLLFSCFLEAVCMLFAHLFLSLSVIHSDG